MSTNTTLVPRTVANRGPASSDDENDKTAETLLDLQNLAAQANKNEAAILAADKLLFSEFMNARNNAVLSREARVIDNKIRAINGQDITTLVGFRNFRGPDYYVNFAGLSTERRARVEPIYGHAILPFNVAVNRMFSIDPETGDPILLDGVDAEVTGEDNGGTATAGTLDNAFNGNNREYWRRRVEFPLDHDADSVAAELVVTLPDSIISDTNMITIHPTPLGELDIEELKYSTDASDPGTVVPGFSVVRGAGFRRWHFQSISMTKLKVKMRQWNFVEENGRKVFYLGAQEIALQLIDFDKTSGQAQPTDNNGLVTVIEAPSGYKFNVLKRLFSDPSYATVGNDTGVFIRIYADASLTDLVWSSYDNARLEDTPKSVSSKSIDKLYMLVTLQWVSAQGKSPLLNDIALVYSVRT